MLDPQDEQAILELEQRRHLALIAVDLATLDMLFDDDLVHVHSTGLVHDKPQLLEHIAHKRGFAGIQRGALNIRGNAGLAVMTGPIINRIRTGDGQEALMHGFVTQTLRHTPSGWKFISFQLTVTQHG